MGDFTYEPPNEQRYHKAVMLALGKQGRTDLQQGLEKAKCVIDVSGTFSRARWNGVATTVTFQVPFEQYENMELDEEGKRVLLAVCNGMMPSEAGLDVLSVDVSPSLYDPVGEETLEKQLAQISESTTKVAGGFALPRDIVEVGKDMADAYLYMYAVENYLRLFIDKASNDHSGAEYPGMFKVPTSVANGVQVRQQEEQKNGWLGVRGGSDLYYMDFKDLGDIITNNWDVFKAYFPDQAWISTKIKELGDCRNLVAHNSVLGEHQRNVIKTNFTSILMQLNPHMGMARN